MSVFNTWRILAFTLTGIMSMQPVAGHEHHGVAHIDMGEPFDAIIIMHMLVQIIAWGFIFPIGMVLGMTKSKWHVPLQTTGMIMTSVGIFMGHHHKGREFPYTAHGTMAKIITFQLIAQAATGVYLKLHIHENSYRPIAVRVHGYLGKTFPIVGWTQILLGVITALGYCMGGETGQCLAHWIMGSAFIAYACIMIIMLVVAANWLKRRGQSQEYIDSWVIMIWGVINTFTMHHDRWNENWTHKDMQHTMMGVLWWAGGALGVFLSKGRKRSVVPAIIIVMTGWGMSAHDQQLMISTKIHGLFGYALMAAGLARIVEICFVLNDSPSDSENIRLFQYLTPYLLTLGGVMFMAATNEEMVHADEAGVDHVTYALGAFSMSFIIFLHMNFLVNLYTNSGKNSAAQPHLAYSKEEGYEAIESMDAEYSIDHDAESFELETQGLDRPK